MENAANVKIFVDEEPLLSPGVRNETPSFKKRPALRSKNKNPNFPKISDLKKEISPPPKLQNNDIPSEENFELLDGRDRNPRKSLQNQQKVISLSKSFLNDNNEENREFFLSEIHSQNYNQGQSQIRYPSQHNVAGQEVEKMKNEVGQVSTNVQTINEVKSQKVNEAYFMNDNKLTTIEPKKLKSSVVSATLSCNNPSKPQQQQQKFFMSKYQAAIKLKTWSLSAAKTSSYHPKNTHQSIYLLKYQAAVKQPKNRRSATTSYRHPKRNPHPSIYLLKYQAAVKQPKNRRSATTSYHHPKRNPHPSIYLLKYQAAIKLKNWKSATTSSHRSTPKKLHQSSILLKYQGVIALKNWKSATYIPRNVYPPVKRPEQNHYFLNYIAVAQCPSMHNNKLGTIIPKIQKGYENDQATVGRFNSQPQYESTRPARSLRWLLSDELFLSGFSDHDDYYSQQGGDQQHEEEQHGMIQGFCKENNVSATRRRLSDSFSDHDDYFQQDQHDEKGQHGMIQGFCKENNVSATRRRLSCLLSDGPFLSSFSDHDDYFQQDQQHEEEQHGMIQGFCKQNNVPATRRHGPFLSGFSDHDDYFQQDQHDEEGQHGMIQDFCKENNVSATRRRLSCLLSDGPFLSGFSDHDDYFQQQDQHDEEGQHGMIQGFCKENNVSATRRRLSCLLSDGPFLSGFSDHHDDYFQQDQHDEEEQHGMIQGFCKENNVSTDHGKTSNLNKDDDNDDDAIVDDDISLISAFTDQHLDMEIMELASFLFNIIDHDDDDDDDEEQIDKIPSSNSEKNGGQYSDNSTVDCFDFWTFSGNEPPSI